MTDTITWHGDLADRLVPAEQVTPHPENPRVGDVDTIADSITANGVYKPLVVQKSTGHILAGNHTYAALVRLGATHVPAHYVDVDNDRAARILAVDNRSSDIGTYDNQALLGLLQGLDADLSGTGYTEDDLADLLVDLETDFPTDDITAGVNNKGINADGSRAKVNRRIIVLDLSVDRYLWLIDALAQVCEARNVDSNVAAILLLAADFTDTRPPREDEGLDDPEAQDPTDD